jgi:hypothetical protein
MYGHFFNWKISNVDRRTKRGGEESFYDSFNRHGWFRLKYIFRPIILEVMRQDIINSNLEWEVFPGGNNQVYSVMSKSRLCKEELGCECLHHFFKVVTAGSFPIKNVVCELTLLKTEIGHNHQWVDCDYHTDYKIILFFGEPTSMESSRRLPAKENMSSLDSKRMSLNTKDSKADNVLHLHLFRGHSRGIGVEALSEPSEESDDVSGALGIIW